MSKLGQRMIAAAEEALAFAEGRATGAVQHDFPDVRAVRSQLGLTQPAFAARFGLPVGSVRDWEQGRVVPDRAAQMLLRVIVQAPQVVARAAASKAVARQAMRKAMPRIVAAATAKKEKAVTRKLAAQTSAAQRPAAKPVARRRT